QDFASYPQMERFIHTLAAQVSREDASASIQKMFEDKLLLSIRRLLQRHKSPRLGVAGGAFANVRLNRMLAENSGDGRRGNAGGWWPVLSAATRRPAPLAVAAARPARCVFGSRLHR